MTQLRKLPTVHHSHAATAAAAHLREWARGASLQKKTLHIQRFLCHNPGSTWNSDENRYAAGRLPGIFESWDQTNAEIPCDPQRWLK